MPFLNLRESRIKFGNKIDKDSLKIINLGSSNDSSDVVQKEVNEIKLNEENDSFDINTYSLDYIDWLNEYNEDDEYDDDYDGFLDLKKDSVYKKYYYQVQNNKLL